MRLFGCLKAGSSGRAVVMQLNSALAKGEMLPQRDLQCQLSAVQAGTFRASCSNIVSTLLQKDGQTAHNARLTVLLTECCIAAGDQPARADLLWTAAERNAEDEAAGQCWVIERQGKLGHLLGTPRQVANEPILESAGGLQDAQHRQVDARSGPSGGPSTISVPSSSGASARGSCSSS